MEPIYRDEVWKEMLEDPTHFANIFTIEQNFQYNIVVLGDKNVGKSTFVSKITNKDSYVTLNQNLMTSFPGEIASQYQGSVPEITKFNLPLSKNDEDESRCSGMTSINH